MAKITNPKYTGSMGGVTLAKGQKVVHAGTYAAAQAYNRAHGTAAVKAPCSVHIAAGATLAWASSLTPKQAFTQPRGLKKANVVHGGIKAGLTAGQVKAKLAKTKYSHAAKGKLNVLVGANLNWLCSHGFIVALQPQAVFKLKG